VILEFDLVRIFLATSIFLYACFRDVRERRVPNNLWIFASSLSIIIFFYQLFLEEGPFSSALLISFLSSFFLLYHLLSFRIFEEEENSRITLILLLSTAASHLMLIHLSFTPVPLLLVLLLLISAVLSSKKRELATLTLLFLSLLILFDLTEILHSRSLLTSFSISFLSIFAFTFLLSYYEIFGWADAKAFWTIALIFPYYPETFSPDHLPLLVLVAPELTLRLALIIPALLLALSLILRSVKIRFPLSFPLLFASFTISFGSFPFSVFLNSVFFNLISLALPLAYFLRNLRKRAKPPKRFMILYAYEKDLDELLREERERKNGYSCYKILEKIIDGEIVSSYRGFDFDEKDLIELRKRKKKVWVTYGVPFMLPITAGLLFAVFRGDILALLIAGG